MTTVKRKATIGSVSSGTMQPGDLYDSLRWELGYLDKERATAFDAEYPFPELDESEGVDVDGERDEFYADAVDALFDALGELTPDFCYFGAHEGDGADYGFWIDWDSLDDAVSSGEIDKGEDTPEWPHDKPFLHVNDHGNATLYSADGVEIWAVV